MISAEAQPSTSFPRPSFSLAEMIGLVAGFALAFSCWPSEPNGTLTSSLGSTPGPTNFMRRGIDFLFLAPIVLAPIVVGQRVKYRDLPRPAEWLLIVAAAYRGHCCLQSQIVPYYWSYIEQTYTQSGFGRSMIFWSVSGFATVLLCVGFLATVAMRRTLSNTGMTLVASILIFLAITGPVSWLGGEIGPWLWAIYGGYGRGESGYVSWGIRVVAAIPLDLLFTVPPVAMFHHPRPPTPRRWTEKAGVILALLYASIWLLEFGVSFLVYATPTFGWENLWSLLLRILFAGLDWLVSLVIAAGLVARFGAQWDDLLIPPSFRPAPSGITTPHALSSP